MTVPFTILLGIAVIILVSGLIRALNTHLKTKRESISAVDESQISARLRDVLDIVISVSDKMDRWECDGVPAADSQRAVSG
ncbi:MAG TPA: hypothetical protein DIC52_20930 [Candidatus Latescibacteria bacterium]|nr:hypothetical protein [Candidatus Latescibacterota bacterium]